MISSIEKIAHRLRSRIGIGAVTFLTFVFGIIAASAENKVVIEKDPVTGEVTMRSIASEPVQLEKSSVKNVEKAEAITQPRETHVSKNPVQDAFSGFWVISGLLLLLIGGVWMLICMAQESVFWLIAGLLLNPIAIFVFLFVHRRQAAGPFLISLSGYLLLYVAYIEKAQ